MKKIVIILFLFTIIFSSCSILPFVKDKNNIKDWMSPPEEDVEYIYNVRDKWFDGEWDEDILTIEITDIDEKSDALLVEYRKNESTDRDYYIVDYIENVICDSEDEYYDKYDDFVFLKTPVEKGNDWYNDDYDFEIISTDSFYETDNEKYDNLIVVDYSSSSTDRVLFYSPDLGVIVYREIESDNYHYIMELDRIRE